jgi:hypothetical protein
MHKVLVENPEGKDHLGDSDIGGRIILKWMLVGCTCVDCDLGKGNVVCYSEQETNVRGFIMCV